MDKLANIKSFLGRHGRALTKEEVKLIDKEKFLRGDYVNMYRHRVYSPDFKNSKEFDKGKVLNEMKFTEEEIDKLDFLFGKDDIIIEGEILEKEESIYVQIQGRVIDHEKR